MATTSATEEAPGIFDQPDHRRKLAIEVEDRRFWVSRETLASYSPVFDAMVYGEFAEASKEVIPLPEKKAEDVEELLLCLMPHPHVKLIDDSNLDLLMAFADEYQIEDISIRAEQFLIKKLLSCEKPCKKLLDLLTTGSKHRMKEFLSLCIGRCAKEFNYFELKPVFPILRTEVVAAFAVAVWGGPCWSCDIREMLDRM